MVKDIILNFWPTLVVATILLFFIWVIEGEYKEDNKKKTIIRRTISGIVFIIVVGAVFLFNADGKLYYKGEIYTELNSEKYLSLTESDDEYCLTYNYSDFFDRLEGMQLIPKEIVKIVYMPNSVSVWTVIKDGYITIYVPEIQDKYCFLCKENRKVLSGNDFCGVCRERFGYKGEQDLKTTDEAIDSLLVQ